MAISNRLITKDELHEVHGLPYTIYIDYDGEYAATVRTFEYVEKATQYFHEFYGHHIENKREQYRHKKGMNLKVIQQLKYVLQGKTFNQGLDVIGHWMSKDVLFPQQLSAHMIPAKKLDMVEIYNHIHKKGNYNGTRK